MAELNCQMHVKTATDYDDIYLTSKSQLVEYDNTISGLSATNTKGAIDELARPTQILDVNGNEILKFGVAPNAVNEVTIRNSVTGSAPIIDATGEDANIGLYLRTKGTGTIVGFIGNSVGLLVKTVGNILNAVNYLTISSNVTGKPVIITTVYGADANIDLVIEAKGIGGVVLNKVNFTEATTLANIVSGESSTTLWGKVKKMFSFIGTDISKLASAYSASSTYDTGAYVTYNNKLYRCTTAITVAEAFNVAKWTESNFSEWSGLRVTNSVTKGTNINTVTTNVVEKTASQVHINFACSTSSAIATGEVVGIIPVGYRPAVSVSVPCQLINNPTVIGYVALSANGNITFNGNLQSGGILLSDVSFTTVI